MSFQRVSSITALVFATTILSVSADVGRVNINTADAGIMDRTLAFASAGTVKAITVVFREQDGHFISRLYDLTGASAL
ncbi:hypothetical protein GCM10023116_36400 [Kistimonas scapharcae]|uniref:Uncharacterized protein n=1 Tax=Kistimonas scapharcae TaxID=1036133 RepID=A0ABP8V631_9GAMM